MSRSFTLFLTFILLVAGSFAGSWYARQAPVAPLTPVEPPTTPLDAVGRPLDPAFVTAMKTENGPKKWLRLVAASEQATAAEFPALIAMAEGDLVALRLIAARWAEVDPRHMFKSLHARLLQAKDPDPNAKDLTRGALIDSLFDTWARNDPAAVLKALNEVPDFSARAELRRNAVSELAKVDPAIALEAMAQWKVTAYPNTKKLQEWAAKDPAAAALAVQKIGNQNVESQVLDVIGQAWAAVDPEAALRHAEKLPPRSRMMLGNQAIEAWAKRDPQGAAAFALSRENGQYRNLLAQAVARNMAGTDPAGAVAWTTANLRGIARNDALASVIGTAAMKDPARAVELLDGLPEGPMQAGAGQSLFQTWFQKQGQRPAALAWLLAQPNEEMRRNALANVGSDWAQQDPAGASDFLTGPHGHLATHNLVSQVANQWATTAPDAAMARAAQLPEAQAPAARSSILGTWIMTRPEAAMTYTTQLPAGPERNSAIVTVTQNLGRRNPAATATFLRSLQGADQQLARSILDQLPPQNRTLIDAALGKP